MWLMAFQGPNATLSSDGAFSCALVKMGVSELWIIRHLLEGKNNRGSHKAPAGLSMHKEVYRGRVKHRKPTILLFIADISSKLRFKFAVSSVFYQNRNWTPRNGVG